MPGNNAWQYCLAILVKSRPASPVPGRQDPSHINRLIRKSKVVYLPLVEKVVNLPPYTYVDTVTSWQQCLAALRQESRLALDFEANSMHAYREQVCLIQISIPGNDYIVDPLAQIDLSGLGVILANAAVEKVLHAAEYDLMLLKRQYGWELHNLFDTMWASRILGYSRVGLASLLEDFYQVRLNKRLQKANWCQRPLSPPHLQYAQCDTHFLLSLRDQLAAELEAVGRQEEAAEIFVEQSRVAPANNDFKPEGFWSIHGAFDLKRPQQAVLKELYLFRNAEARQRNLPVFKVLGDKTLLEIAQRLPRRPEELSQVQGMSAGQMRRYGRRLLQIVREAQIEPPPPFPRRPPRPSPDVLERYEKLQSWRKERAARRGVESDVIVSREALWLLAQVAPQTVEELNRVNSLGKWRRQAYGQEILDLLSKGPNDE
jgi:ribonuclease D